MELVASFGLGVGVGFAIGAYVAIWMRLLFYLSTFFVFHSSSMRQLSPV